ncbi:uncharacterized protein PHACADRAFT_253907 [Phanerochaete carnosa HHB-10118-sp]|uniref:Uncharacterized protein n=1 Tax=Phanerochaete carnosa (strain HHB-10118-sp) TaxID=650164 RepID=K5WCC3_PHACS|nr:uncharacterized protein PHACADRAFT_253907 [Phanerochaete carnosa HHB-10118-sp]EKM56659.1 hypothetical protein PHACADRAFT_253907 [Phanerochaete carnosa HHB-10118-sp]
MRPSLGHLLSYNAVVLGSVALLFSGLIQLAVSWMQMQHRASQQSSCARSVPVSNDFEKDYSWEGDDYPPYLPLDLGEPVAMVLEDSRHYSLNSSEADAEWLSIYPGGQLGFVHLGPQKRFFSLSLYHQIHCLDSLRHAILNGKSHDGEQGHGHGHTRKRDVEHSAHCLNYLRQTIMCAADLTLEPEIVLGSSDVGEGLGAVHVCRDWSRVHEYTRQNWQGWMEWQVQSLIGES